MLRRLTVSNYILIDALEIEFDEHLNIFAIPSTELAANPELHQNPGYATVE